MKLQLVMEGETVKAFADTTIPSTTTVLQLHFNDGKKIEMPQGDDLQTLVSIASIFGLDIAADATREAVEDGCYNGSMRFVA